MPEAARPISDSDWTQLITLASGFLVLEDGDVKSAMSRALSAHAELIRALKKESIRADLPQGTVTMFVPDEGGVALRLEKKLPGQPIPEDELPTMPQQGSTTFQLDGDE